MYFCFINLKSLEVTVNLFTKADGVALAVSMNVILKPGIASGISYGARRVVVYQERLY